MTDCINGTITGTNNYGGCAAHGFNQAACIADMNPWGYSCCDWGGPMVGCKTANCAALDNPDECPGCNWCKDVGTPGYLGWQIDGDRGAIPQDIWVDGAVAPQHPGNGILINGGHELHCAQFLVAKVGGGGGGHRYMESPSYCYEYGWGRVPPPP